MSIFQTLFGGALTIAALYYLLRAFGVSNYWRGVISGIVPAVAYLAYATVSWPGGDVMSMHVAVFLATATALTLIGARRAGERKKLHWAPMLIILFFFCLFLVDGALLLISGQGVPPVVAKWLLPPAKKTTQLAHTAFSGVVPHGEEAAKSINQHMASTDKQNRLGWKVTVTGMDRLAHGGETGITLIAREKDDRPLRGATVAMAMMRPGLTQPEMMVALVETDAGVYRGSLSLTLPGLWVAVIRMQRANDRYEMQQHVEVSATQ